MKNKKTVTLLILCALCAAISSCGGADSNDNYQFETVKTAYMELASDEDDYVTLDETYAVYFKTESNVHSINVRLVSDDKASATVRLYEWQGDYESTVSASPVKESSFFGLLPKDENIVSSLAFTTGLMPPKGEYLAVFSSKSGASLKVGKKTDSAVENGTVCYKNGVVIDDVPYMRIEYFDGDVTE